MDNINIKEIIFTYIDEDSKEHTVTLDNFVNVKDLQMEINKDYEHTRTGVGNILTSVTSKKEVIISLKCDEFEIEEV